MFGVPSRSNHTNRADLQQRLQRVGSPTIPQIGLIAGTRAMLGAGIALLLSEKLSGEQRRAIGWTLVAVGALTTIPLALQLLDDDE